MLTLDGQGKQTVLLLDEPNGNTLFRIWNRDNDNNVKGSLTMGVAGNAFFNVKDNGALEFSAPKGNAQSTDTRPMFR
jgi:hypothetical protein